MGQDEPGRPDPTPERIARAVGELAKGQKSASFYPKGHPALAQTLARIVAVLEEIPLPDSGLEIGVTKGALLWHDAPLPAPSKATADLNRELYLRRASRVIFLPGQREEEVLAFLRTINTDLQELQDEGGIERALLREGVSRIWANRIDYEGLTEMLKREEEGEEEPEPAEEVGGDEEAVPAPVPSPAGETEFDALLDRLSRETDPAAYRDAVYALVRLLFGESAGRRPELAPRALALLAAHAERPPGKDPEIAAAARTGIRELADDDLVALYIKFLREPGGLRRREAETVLVHFGERSVKPLLATLAEEKDILARKSIVDVVVRIGRPAVPALLPCLKDPRWFIVRNVLTIVGNLGLPELAPSVAEALGHGDLRVKKEAIRALAKLPHPAAVAELGRLCFDPVEGIALSATAALAQKREAAAIDILYRRAVHKRAFFPRYRIAQEAIDALRAIGTVEALTALEYVSQARAIFETARFRGMKLHALRSLARIPGHPTREILKNTLTASEEYLREEARRLLRKLESER